MIYRRFLNIALACAALAASSARGDDGIAALAAYDAFRAGDPERLERHARALGGTVLEPWAEYWRLRLLIEQAGAEEMGAYLQRYSGTYLAEQMRADWLRELGRRQHWGAFERELGPLVQDDPELRCHAWRARLARGDMPALIEARALWLEPRELDEGCRRLADQMLSLGAADEALVWQRARLLLARNLVSAGRRALEDLPAATRPEDTMLSQAATAPRRLLARGDLDLERRAVREMLVFAVLRLARSDVDAAAEALLAGAAAGLPRADREYVWALLAWRIAQDHRPEALEWYVRAGEAALDDGQLAWKARAALRAGRWRTLLQTIEPMSPQAKLDLAWTYWAGRAHEALGDPERARAHYERIAGGPLYYSVLATEALGGHAAIPVPHHVPSEEEVDEARRNPELARALELYRLGLRTEATREWMFSVRLMSDRRLLAAAELARRAGVYDRAIGTASRTDHVHDYRMRYLTPYRDVFRAYAEAHDLEEAWLFGTVRQESRFIIDARSGAGASGLMQLLPDTARWMAQRIGHKGYSAKRVTDVETNITLGSRYLQHMLERTGHPVLASTAYNAGLNRARRWLPERALEGAVFIESIPFDETREYVKRVMANTVHYALLLEGGSMPLSQRLGWIAARGTPDTARSD
jgi:soluble lytic murein transglycosylase